MAISSIGLQNIQTTTGTPQQPPATPPAGAPNDSKVAEAAPVQSSPTTGTGQFVDTTA